MKYPPDRLTNGEVAFHAELLKMAGMGCSKELSKLSEHQKSNIKILADKGYVKLTKKKFMVVLPVENPN